MEEDKIILIGNETDVLHCGFSHAISDSGKRFPSAEHYAHSMILSQLGLDDSHILELLGCRSNEVKSRARALLVENMPAGHDLESLRQYLETSRQSYTMQGLRIRIEQDATFEKALMDTREALLIVCDENEKELGIGMNEMQFMEYMKRERLDAQRIGLWLRNSSTRPANLGANQLGYFLMWLRFEVKEKRRTTKINFEPYIINGLSTDDDGNPVKIACNDQIVFLKGIFRPLSNFYAHPFEMKGGRYRSVEHYAYEKLFNALHFDEKCLEKVVTTVNPCDLPKVVAKVFAQQKVDVTTIEGKLQRLDRWRQSAMKHKIMKIEYLQQLLLSTGQALLVDTSPADSDWVCGTNEPELQHLLIKEYVNTEQLVKWMCAEEPPARLAHLKGNKGALLLMELRAKFAESTTSRIPLVTPPLNPNLLASITPHIICFSSESVWHPLYPAEIRAAPDQPLLPSPAHYVAQETAKYFMFNEADSQYVLEDRRSVECWRRMYETIEGCNWGQEREQMWYMEKRQKMIYEALRLLLEQHAPLLRALLDTGDSFLAFVSRWDSIDAELSIGMREHDLRRWLAYVELDSKQLAEMCTRPLAFRPPYLGGNRIGFILMELRAEFRSKGAVSWTLPELSLGPEVILGSDSPMENLMADEEFDVLSPVNYSAIWCNPLLLSAKKSKDQTLLQFCHLIKAPPKLLSVNEERIGEILQQMDATKPDKLDLQFLGDVAPEDLRAIFMKLCVRIRQKATECDRQQQELSTLANEISQMQALRRGIENDQPIPHIPMQNEMERHNGNFPPQGSMLRDRQPPMRQRSPLRAPGGGRDRDDQRRGPPPQRRSLPDDRRRDSRPPPREYVQKPRPHREEHRERPPQQLPSKPEPVKVVEAPKQPPPPKRERKPDEELSEGEILTSEDEA
ncbi:unnamed protein product, partial [Mesorhabditis belari]|uniref:NADAR domain-containing protein n=1 Tax=Mesorhabditis belari TaxID=2138241 RepID=A0AAF3EW17_9BILA